MWRAKLGHTPHSPLQTCSRCSTCDPKPTQGFKVWTPEGGATSIELEVERVRGVCAKVALENAALSTLIPKLRKECAGVKVALVDGHTKCTSRQRDLGEMIKILRDDFDRLVEKQQAQHIGKVDGSKALIQSALETLRVETKSQLNALDSALRESIAAAVHQLQSEQKTFQTSYLSSLASLEASIEQRREQEAEHVRSEVRALTDYVKGVRDHVDTAVEGVRDHVDTAVKGVNTATDTKVGALHTQVTRLMKRAKEREVAADEENASLLSKLGTEKEERHELENRCVRLENRVLQQEKMLIALLEQQREREVKREREFSFDARGEYNQPAFPREHSYSMQHAASRSSSSRFHPGFGDPQRFQPPHPPPVQAPLGFTVGGSSLDKRLEDPALALAEDAHASGVSPPPRQSQLSATRAPRESRSQQQHQEQLGSAVDRSSLSSPPPAKATPPSAPPQAWPAPRPSRSPQPGSTASEALNNQILELISPGGRNSGSPVSEMDLQTTSRPQQLRASSFD